MYPAWFLGLAADQAAATPLPPPLALPWWRVGVLLAILLGLGAVWWRVNRGRINFERLFRTETPRIAVREQRWLQGKTSIALVEVDGERFLLAQSQHALAWQPLRPGRGEASAGPKPGP